jgi:hypothetical protein
MAVAGVDSAWELRKLEASKMLQNPTHELHDPNALRDSLLGEGVN